MNQDFPEWYMCWRIGSDESDRIMKLRKILLISLQQYGIKILVDRSTIF